MRILSAILFSTMLCSCATSTYVVGKLSTAAYDAPPQPPSFVVISPDTFSLTERNISSLIEKKMTERGYRKAASIETANVAVAYSYKVGPGQTNVTSSPDFVSGGHSVQSYTTYPRFFHIMVVDLKKSKLPEHVELIWQGELRSSGWSSDISDVADYFIEALFEQYGESVTNKKFRKTME